MVTAYVAVEPRTSKNGTPEGIMYLVTASCYRCEEVDRRATRVGRLTILMIEYVEGSNYEVLGENAL